MQNLPDKLSEKKIVSHKFSFKMERQWFENLPLDNLRLGNHENILILIQKQNRPSTIEC